MSEWQPIETAPKDGTRILVVCMKTKNKNRLGLIQADYFDKDLGCFGKFNRGFFPPTHWMPLPPLPGCEYVCCGNPVMDNGYVCCGEYEPK